MSATLLRQEYLLLKRLKNLAISIIASSGCANHQEMALLAADFESAARNWLHFSSTYFSPGNKIEPTPKNRFAKILGYSPTSSFSPLPSLFFYGDRIRDDACAVVEKTNHRIMDIGALGGYVGALPDLPYPSDLITTCCGIVSDMEVERLIALKMELLSQKISTGENHFLASTVTRQMAVTLAKAPCPSEIKGTPYPTKNLALFLLGSVIPPDTSIEETITVFLNHSPPLPAFQCVS